MSRALLGLYQRRIDLTETRLKFQSPGAALLIADSEAFASNSKALPVKGAGNPEFTSAVSSGSTSHFFSNKKQAVMHNKRGIATSAAGAAAGMGAGMGMGAAVGGAAAAAGIGVVIGTAAITGGIALGGLVLGIGVAALIGLYVDSQKSGAHNRFTGATADESYSSTEMMSDLRYLLSNGDLENLARFQDKAIESGKFLDTALDAAVDTCGDAATLAYAMSRHKWRLREKLDKSKEMSHIAAFRALIDNKIAAASQMCEIMGEMHAANIMLHLATSGTGTRTAQQNLSYLKSADVAAEVRDYIDLRWSTWWNRLTSGEPPAGRPWMNNLATEVTFRLRGMNRSQKNDMKEAMAVILKEAKNASDGDHKNVCGKLMDALEEADAALSTRVTTQESATGAGGARTGGVGLKDFGSAQLQGVLINAGTTASTSASVSSAFGAGAIGSATNIASGAGAGLAAGILVSALVGYALEKENDKRNVKAIYENTVTDPAQRIWLLRSMMQAGRLETLTESFKKCQQSIQALQAMYGNSDHIRRAATGISGAHTETTHADLVLGAKHLFRVQKHLLRMLAVSSVLYKFFDELDAQIDKMLADYSKEGGQVDKTLTKVERQANKLVHNCPGTCYRVTQTNGTVVKVANRLASVPTPKPPKA